MKILLPFFLLFFLCGFPNLVKLQPKTSVHFNTGSGVPSGKNDITNSEINKKDLAKRSFVQSNINILHCDTIKQSLNANCELKLVLKNSAYSTNVCNDSLLYYSIIIDLYNDGIDDWEFSSFLPLNNDIQNANNGKLDEIRDDNGNGIKDIYVSPGKNMEEVTVKIPEYVVGEVSTHIIKWEVFDGCQKFNACIQTILLTDNTKPTPYCGSVSDALLTEHTFPGLTGYYIELFAKEFNIVSFDNCTSMEDIFFTFDNWTPQITDTLVNGKLINLETPHYFDKNGAVVEYPTTNDEIIKQFLMGELQLWNPDWRSSFKSFSFNIMSIEDLKKSVDILVTVWDKNLNSDYCHTKLEFKRVYHPAQNVRIAGRVLSEKGDSIPGVSVFVNRNAADYPVQTATQQGQFKFFTHASLHASDVVQIYARKDDDYKYGVSTLDLVYLLRHILGIESLPNPYRFIAADVNNDQKINSHDLVSLRTLILGISDKFENSSWRFPILHQNLSQNQVFPYKDTIIELVFNHTDSLDFVGVKIGDVDLSGMNGLRGQTSESRNNQFLRFLTENKIVNGNQTIDIPITSDNYKEIWGFQFSLSLNNALLVDIIPGVLDISKFNSGIFNNRRISISYACPEAQSFADDDILFILRIRPDADLFLSDCIVIDSVFIKPEAYCGSNKETWNVQLDLVFNELIPEFILFQNEPNPFQKATFIKFYTALSQDFVFTVFDVSGRVFEEKTITSNPGYNTLTYYHEHIFPNSGIYFYQLTNKKHSATKKMVFISNP